MTIADYEWLLHFAEVIQHQWPWNSSVNKYLFGDIMSPSQTLVLWNIKANTPSIFCPKSRDISPALILTLMSINLLIWRQLRLMPFVRMQAGAFQWARRWFALLSVRVSNHNRERWSTWLISLTLFCGENGSNGIHNDIGEAHTGAVNTHTHKPAALRPVKSLSHCRAISSSWADGLLKSRTKTRKSAQICESMKQRESFTTNRHLTEAYTHPLFFLSATSHQWGLLGFIFGGILKWCKAVTREPITLSKIAWFHQFFMGGTAWRGFLIPKPPCRSPTPSIQRQPCSESWVPLFMRLVIIIRLLWSCRAWRWYNQGSGIHHIPATVFTFPSSTDCTIIVNVCVFILQLYVCFGRAGCRATEWFPAVAVSIALKSRKR